MLLTIFVPTAMADGVSSVRLSFDSPAEATAQISSTFDGQHAADARQSIDSEGDRDGTVTQEEVDAYEAEMRQVFGQEAWWSSDEITGGIYTMDEERLSSAGVDEFQIQGATGDGESTKTVTWELTMVFTWNVTSGGSHTFLVRADGPGEDEPPENVMFEFLAPSGYRIAGTSGVPEESEFSSDRRMLTLTLEVRSDREFSVTFERGGDTGGIPEPNGVPGVGTVAALLAVAAAGFYLRRRLHR